MRNTGAEVSLDQHTIRKILQVVKDRVQGRVESMARQKVEFTIYVLLLMIFVFAMALLILRPLTWTTWLLELAAGGAWLLIGYAPMLTWIGAALGVLTGLGLRQALQESGGST